MEKKKLFKDLVVGDKIYKFYVDDWSGPYDDIYEMTVDWIEFDHSREEVDITAEVYSDSCLCSVDINYVDYVDSVFDDEDAIYCTTEEEAKSVYRRMLEEKLASHQSAAFDIKEKLKLLNS